MNLTVMNPTVPQLFNFMIGVLGLTCLTAFLFVMQLSLKQPNHRDFIPDRSEQLNVDRGHRILIAR